MASRVRPRPRPNIPDVVTYRLRLEGAGLGLGLGLDCVVKDSDSDSDLDSAIAGLDTSLGNPNRPKLCHTNKSQIPVISDETNYCRLFSWEFFSENNCVFLI